MGREQPGLFFFGEGKTFRGVGRRLRGASAVKQAFSTHRRALWISETAVELSRILRTFSPRDTWHRLLLLDRASPARRELLNVHFRSIVNPDGQVKLLAPMDLVEVFKAEHPEDYLVGGVVDADDEMVIFYRGNLEPIVVPFAWFRTSKKGPRPDFHDLELTDCGQTVRLGAYEAATDAILYEFAEDTRRRLKNLALEQDNSVGAAIRRLRLQKGLSRNHFGKVAEKTLARIERGEVKRPNKRTLELIASRLGVTPRELASY